jgi:hypothetical protein
MNLNKAPYHREHERRERERESSRENTRLRIHLEQEKPALESFRKLGSTYSKPEIIKLAELTAHEDPIFNSISKKSDKETSWV